MKREKWDVYEEREGGRRGGIYRGGERGGVEVFSGQIGVQKRKQEGNI